MNNSLLIASMLPTPPKNVRINNVPKPLGISSALLPIDRLMDASFFHSRKQTSVFATVKKAVAPDRPICQDTTVIYVCDEFLLAAVLDGCGKYGHMLSEKVGEALLKITHEERDKLSKNPDLRSLIVRATLQALFFMVPGTKINAGSTAVLTLLLSDGNFYSVNIGDSTQYVITKNAVKRLFTVDVIRYGENSIPVTSLSLEEYDQLPKSPGSLWRYGIVGAVELKKGKLEPGDRLLLASDGTTDALSVKIDQTTGKILDISGCDDIAKVITPGVDVRVSIEELARLTLSEAYLESVLRYPIPKDVVRAPSFDDQSVILIGYD